MAPPVPEAESATTPGVQWDSWVSRHSTMLDLWTGVAAFVVLGLPTILPPSPQTVAQSLGFLLAGVGLPAAISVRHRWPIASAVAVNAIALAHVVLGVPLTPADLLIYLSVYSTTVHAPLWARRVSLAAALLGSLILAAPEIGLFARESWDPVSGVFVAVGTATPALFAWALGLLRRSTRQRWESLAERARRLERERDQQAQIAAAAERARIAREMHDVVAHSLSIVIAQADGGRYAARTSPQAAEAALGTIAETGREALADMRRILGVLRTSSEASPGADGPAPAQPPLAPQPTGEEITALVESVRATGRRVDLVITGQERRLPDALGLAAYRVCQESLTNVLKHAGPGARARLDLAWYPSALVVRVDDDGVGVAAPTPGTPGTTGAPTTTGGDADTDTDPIGSPGHGLVGMRERVALFGGEVWTGARPGGGFRVQASFPLHGAPLINRATPATPVMTEPGTTPRSTP
ncbi:signal transduction histidine kinase [Serinibacter salmoneus]|uniref:histidine kinase n=2 Tax=Serinibacter salmoneus TaxID=556530 RepID=A0A2A9CYG4_9MICO|nr:signal transduction histidine kinase [Serinibacter salmoneus]